MSSVYFLHIFNAGTNCVQLKSSPLINKLQAVTNWNASNTSRKHTKYPEKTCISWICSKCSSSAPRYGTNPNSRHRGKISTKHFPHSPLTKEGEFNKLRISMKYWHVRKDLEFTARGFCYYWFIKYYPLNFLIFGGWKWDRWRSDVSIYEEENYSMRTSTFCTRSDRSKYTLRSPHSLHYTYLQDSYVKLGRLNP